METDAKTTNRERDFDRYLKLRDKTKTTCLFFKKDDESDTFKYHENALTENVTDAAIYFLDSENHIHILTKDNSPFSAIQIFLFL